MKKTGEILKKAREAKGLSLHEIGLSLKISSKVLKGIEEGDEANLPAKTFLRGFVQSYANYLHLDPNQVLEVFYEEMGSTRPKPYIRPNDNERPPSKEDMAADSPTETPLKPQVRGSAGETKSETEASVTPLKKSSATDPDSLKRLREPKSTRTILISILVICLVGLIIFTKKMIDKYSKEAEVPTNEISQTMEGTTPVAEENPNPTNDTPTVTETNVDGKEAAPATSMTPISTKATPAPVSEMTSPTPNSTPNPVTTATPKATTPPAATAAATPVATATAAPTATPAPTVAASPSPSPTPKPEGNKPVELIVEALDTVEIEYASPSGKPQKIKLSAEQVHTFKSRSGLKINFSNGGAVNLIMNGKDLGIPGDLGKPIKLSY